jgi:hypothetical protein
MSPENLVGCEIFTAVVMESIVFWDMTPCSLLSCNLVDTVQVVKEVPQPVGAVWPDDESVVHVTKPAERLMGSPVERHLLEVFHVEVGDDRRQW